MHSIPEFMTADHRQCDALFSDTETAVSQSDWSLAEQHWQAFEAAIEHHFQMEEQTLFPAFEAATGMTSGPTAVMRMEHQQMRQLIGQINTALTQQDADEVLGLSETLMVLMQQHNMKEEQVLYPMSERALPDPSATLQSMQTC